MLLYDKLVSYSLKVWRVDDSQISKVKVWETNCQKYRDGFNKYKSPASISQKPKNISGLDFSELLWFLGDFHWRKMKQICCK